MRAVWAVVVLVFGCSGEAKTVPPPSRDVWTTPRPVRVPTSDGHRLVFLVADSKDGRVARSADGRRCAMAVRDVGVDDGAVALFEAESLTRVIAVSLERYAEENGLTIVEGSAPCANGRGVLSLPLDVEAPAYVRGEPRLRKLVEWSRSHRPGSTTEKTISVFPTQSTVLERAGAGLVLRRAGAPPTALWLAAGAAPALAALNDAGTVLVLWDRAAGFIWIDAKSGETLGTLDSPEPIRALECDVELDVTAIGESGVIYMLGRRGQFGPMVPFWTLYDTGDRGSVAVDARGGIELSSRPAPYEGEFLHCALSGQIVSFELCVAKGYEE